MKEILDIIFIIVGMIALVVSAIIGIALLMVAISIPIWGTIALLIYLIK